jgi:hypothetical protein
MTMPRPQFTLKTMLWVMVCAACFVAGMTLQKRLCQPVYIKRVPTPMPYAIQTEVIELNGERWSRQVASP